MDQQNSPGKHFSSVLFQKHSLIFNIVIQHVLKHIIVVYKRIFYYKTGINIKYYKYNIESKQHKICLPAELKVESVFKTFKIQYNIKSRWFYTKDGRCN